MKPTDFIAVATKLSADTEEAALRSAVSRAYYGAMHEARVLIESCGFKFGTDLHGKLPMCMDSSGDADLRTAGSQLGTLRTIRNDADYKLADPKFSKKFAALQIAIAIKIVDIV